MTPLTIRTGAPLRASQLRTGTLFECVDGIGIICGFEGLEGVAYTRTGDGGLHRLDNDAEVRELIIEEAK